MISIMSHKIFIGLMRSAMPSTVLYIMHHDHMIM